MNYLKNIPITKKIIIAVTLVIIIFLIIFLSKGNNDVIESEDDVYRNTIDISRNYVDLRIKTDKILSEASSYESYDIWDSQMTELINDWKDLEEEAESLEKQSTSLSKDKLSLNLVNSAQAYTKDEISNVFDKAPAGKKIKTLAKYLGVDAKRAFKILKTDQDFVKADAWNEAGDTFKKLEVSAVVIKDGCKVVGYVGAMALTGGAAGTAALGSAGLGTAVVGGSATVAQATVMVVTGTDLVLEIGEDTASIALGDNHKSVKAISSIRSYTDPAASILSLSDIPKNISKGASLLDKVGVVLVQVDQIRSMAQDGKLLGIKISPDSKIEVASIEENEVDEWMDEYEKEMEEITNEDFNDIDDWMDDFEDIDEWLDELDEEIEDELIIEEEVKEEIEEEVVDVEFEESVEKIEEDENRVKTEKELFYEKYRL